jgi:hypothetical protein
VVPGVPYGHDRAWHLLQRWITYRMCRAIGDLFLGPHRHGPARLPGVAGIKPPRFGNNIDRDVKRRG